MHRRSLPLAAIALFPLAGCAVGPVPRTPTYEALGVPPAFRAQPAAEATPAAIDLAHWWDTFDDPTLGDLVAKALAANTDVEAAGARVRQARAALRSEQAGWLPSLSVGGSATRRTGGGSTSGVAPAAGARTIYDAGFDAAYEVDLFGGTRRAVQAARADAAAALATLHSTQLTIASEVALNYVDARLAQRRLAIARANLAAQDETLRIVGWRVQAGLVGSLDLEQARGLRAQTAAGIPLLEQNYAAALNRLAVLLAQPPGAVDVLFASAADVPLAPLPQAAIPADVLRRRPDVSAAERALAAEIARIGVREADLLPALRLSGSFGGSGTAFRSITDDAIGTLVASITAPIFQGGRLRAALESQRASAAAALANYRGTVLSALEDTENALVSVGAAERREAELAVAEEAARNAATLARSQYQAGLIDFQSLLESERSLLSSEDGRASARAARASASIQLFKALGGGWEAAPEPRTLSSANP